MIADTNVLLRYLLGSSEPQYEEAKELIESTASITVEPVVIAECIYILSGSYTKTHGQVVDVLIGLFSIDNFDNMRLCNKALELFRGSGLDFVDCYLITVSIDRAEPLLTFDKKMQKVYETEKAKSIQ